MVVEFPTRSHSSHFLFFLASSSFFFLVSASLIIFSSCCSSLSFLLIASSSLRLASLIFLRSWAVGMFWLSLCVFMYLNIFLFWIVPPSYVDFIVVIAWESWDLRLWEQGRLVPDYFVIDVRAWLLFSVATSTVVYNNLTICTLSVSVVEFSEPGSKFWTRSRLISNDSTSPANLCENPGVWELCWENRFIVSCNIVNWCNRWHVKWYFNPKVSSDLKKVRVFGIIRFVLKVDFTLKRLKRWVLRL